MPSRGRRGSWWSPRHRTALAFVLLVLTLPGFEAAAQHVARPQVAVIRWVDPSLTSERDDDSRSCTWGVVRKAGIAGLFAAALGVGYMAYLHAEWPAVDQPSTGEFLGLVGAGLVMGGIDGYVKTPRCHQPPDDVIRNGMVRSLAIRRPQHVPAQNVVMDPVPVPGAMPR